MSSQEQLQPREVLIFGEEPVKYIRARLQDFQNERIRYKNARVDIQTSIRLAIFQLTSALPEDQKKDVHLESMIRGGYAELTVFQPTNNSVVMKEVAPWGEINPVPVLDLTSEPETWEKFGGKIAEELLQRINPQQD